MCTVLNLSEYRHTYNKETVHGYVGPTGKQFLLVHFIALIIIIRL